MGLLYFAVGQLLWFACVLSVAHGAAWIGAVVSLPFLALHVARARRPAVELAFVAGVALLGGAWETLVTASGLLDYPPGGLIGAIFPYWLVPLWALLAAQLRENFSWLVPRPLLSAVLAAVSGPVSFRAGAALGALRLVDPVPALALIAAGWALLFPTVIWLSRRWDGVYVKPRAVAR